MSGKGLSCPWLAQCSEVKKKIKKRKRVRCYDSDVSSYSSQERLWGAPDAVMMF